MDKTTEDKKKYKTSAKVRQKWEEENYKKYVVRFRNKDDMDLIKFVAEEKERGINTTELFRKALYDYMLKH